VFEVQPIPVKLRCSSSGTDPIVAKPIIPARTVVESEMIIITLVFLFRPATYPLMMGATNMKSARPVKVGNSSPRKVKINHKAMAVKIPVASLNNYTPLRGIPSLTSNRRFFLKLLMQPSAKY